jgi:hypothetical protein
MTEEEIVSSSPMLNNISFFTCEEFKKLSVSRMPLSSASEELDVWVHIKCFIKSSS